MTRRKSQITSFIADMTRAKVAEAPRDTRAVITVSLDLNPIRTEHATLSHFRDKRLVQSELLLALDGKVSGVVPRKICQRRLFSRHRERRSVVI